MTAEPIANGGLSRRGVPLIDGIEKVTGRARYTADLDHAGALVGRILRSPVSHGEIIRLDVSRARALEGVEAIVTGDDCEPDLWRTPHRHERVSAGPGSRALPRRAHSGRGRRRRRNGRARAQSDRIGAARAARLLHVRRILASLARCCCTTTRPAIWNAKFITSLATGEVVSKRRISSAASRSIARKSITPRSSRMPA